MKSRVKECAEYIRTITDFTPRAALILGSGLGAYTQQIENVVCTIPYKDIPGFPVSTVSGHNGRMIMGYIEDVPVVCMDGGRSALNFFSSPTRPAALTAILCRGP